VGIELQQPGEVVGMQARMLAEGFAYEYLNDKPDFLSLLV
jgi:threonine dehydratase